MAKTKRPARKLKPKLTIEVPEAIEQQVDAGTLRLGATKTALVIRAIQTFFRLESEVIGGAKILLQQADGRIETLIFP